MYLLMPHPFCLKNNIIHEDCSIENCFWDKCKKCNRDFPTDYLNDKSVCEFCEAKN